MTGLSGLREPQLRHSRRSREKEDEHMYKPEPIDTSKVVLPEELLSLTEKIACNVHDVWAKRRMEEGYTFGPTRDDVKKTNPCLVPCDELPESEKEYDRRTAMETIALIVSLGYTISRPE